MNGLTAEQIAAGVPRAIGSRKLLELVIGLGVAPEVAENVSAVDLGPNRVTISAHALAAHRLVEVAVTIRVDRNLDAMLEGWGADPDLNGSAS